MKINIYFADGYLLHTLVPSKRVLAEMHNTKLYRTTNRHKHNTTKMITFKKIGFFRKRYDNYLIADMVFVIFDENI